MGYYLIKFDCSRGGSYALDRSFLLIFALLLECGKTFQKPLMEKYLMIKFKPSRNMFMSILCHLSLPEVLH